MIAITESDAHTPAVYRGPLEDFIARRDALAKELKGRGLKDDASRVKALKKPSKLAWALDQAALDEPAVLRELVTAIESAQSPHADASAARSAQERIRTGVRAVADAAARAGVRFRQPIDASDLVPAVRAVIGDGAAFTALMAGSLVDVPEGGGLDLLTGMTLPGGASGGGSSEPAADRPLPAASATKGAPSTVESTARVTRRESVAPGEGVAPRTEAAPEHANERKRDAKAAERAKREAEAAAERASREARIAHARRELIRADTALSAARGRAQAAERTVLGAQARLEAAEEQLERAREQADARRGELDRAHADAKGAQDALDQAERKVAELRAAAEAAS